MLTVLQKASNDVKSAFPQFNSIVLNWAFVATWYNVPFYGAPCNNTIKHNTFQSILVTDGVYSFAIFLYNSITWTTGTASGGDCNGLGGTPARAGFDAGDGINVHNIEGSCTNDIINVASLTNVGVPGKFIFRVENEQIQTPEPPKTSTQQSDCEHKFYLFNYVYYINTTRSTRS